MKTILKNKLYTLPLIADLISNLGDMLFYLALMNYVLLLPDATLAISAISLSEMLPKLTSVLTGFWADNTKNKLRTIIYTLLFRVVIYSIIGLLMGFSPALWVVLCVAGLNFFSDIAGQYESGLFIPISIKVITNEQREMALGFRQTVMSIADIAFQLVSAILVSLLSFQTLAFVNAGTFLLSVTIILAIYQPLQKLTTVDTTDADTQEDSDEKISLGKRLSLVYTHLKSQPTLRNAFVMIISINAVCAPLYTTLLLYLDKNKSFVIVNTAFTLSLFPIIMACATILGSFLSMNLLKKLSLQTGIAYLGVFTTSIYICFFIETIYGVLICIALMAVITGAINPKFSAHIMNTLPSDSLGTTIGSLNMLLNSGIILVTTLVAAIIPFISISIIVIALIIVTSLLTLVFAIKPTQKG